MEYNCKKSNVLKNKSLKFKKKKRQEGTYKKQKKAMNGPALKEALASTTQRCSEKC